MASSLQPSAVTQAQQATTDPVSLFFSFRGRVGRGDFWYAALVVLSALAVFDVAMDRLFDRSLPIVLVAAIVWSLLALGIKRYHDIGRSGWWLLLLAIPIIGPAWVLYSIGFRKGQPRENRYGAPPGTNELDYLTVRRLAGESETTVNDVTAMNPVEVTRVVRPTSVEEIQTAIAESTGPVSIGGGRFSMGGQTASPSSLHLDL